MVIPFTDQTYDGLSEPSSGSVAFALQERAVPVYTPEPGLIVTFDTTGGEFPIETDDDVLVTTTPSESVALATHSKVTPGVAKDGDSASVPVLQNHQRQTGIRDTQTPSFTSMAVAIQVNRLLEVTPTGEIAAL